MTDTTTIADASMALLIEWENQHRRPGCIHITLNAAEKLADEVQPSTSDPELLAVFREHGQDVSELERMDEEQREWGRSMRDSLSRMGTAGTLWGLPLEIHEDGPADVWLTASEPLPPNPRSAEA